MAIAAQPPGIAIEIRAVGANRVLEGLGAAADVGSFSD